MALAEERQENYNREQGQEECSLIPLSKKLKQKSAACQLHFGRNVLISRQSNTPELPCRPNSEEESAGQYLGGIKFFLASPADSEVNHRDFDIL